MYLVVPRRPASAADLLLAHAAGAAVRCVDAFSSSQSWAPSFTEWDDSSFRKVCLRARPSELDAVRLLDHAECGEVLCLPPRRRSAAGPELARLQVHIGAPLRASGNSERDLDPRAMLILIRGDLGLTVGKACAQVAHAVLTAERLHSPAAVERWRSARWPVAVRLVEGDTFERAKQELVIAAVRDAGLTQVAPGTETVLATEPGAQLPEWLWRTTTTPDDGGQAKKHLSAGR